MLKLTILLQSALLTINISDGDVTNDNEDLSRYKTRSDKKVSVMCTHKKSKSTSSLHSNQASTESANGTIADDVYTTKSETEDTGDDADVNTERDDTTFMESGTKYLDGDGIKNMVKSTTVPDDKKTVDESVDYIIDIKSESEDDEDTDSETENTSVVPSLEVPGENLPINVTKATTKSEITTISDISVNVTKEVKSTTTRHLCTWMPKRKLINKAGSEHFIDSDKFHEDFVASLVFINDPDITFHCILVVVSKNCLIARASCLYRLKGDVVSDYFVLKLLPDKVKQHKLYEVAGLSYHPLIWKGGLEMYNYAVVKTDGEIDMRTEWFPVIPMNFDIMSLYVGQKVLLLGFVRFISTVQQQNLVKFQGHLIPETYCSEPPPMKLFFPDAVNDTSKPFNSSKFHCIVFLDQVPKGFRNFSRVAPVFRGLKFMGFVKRWNIRKPMPLISLIGVRDWIQDVIAVSI